MAERDKILDEVIAEIQDEKRYIDLKFVGRGCGYIVDIDRVLARVEKLKNEPQGDTQQ